MIITKKSLPRRTFLKGMHATLAKKGEVGIVCMLLRSKRAGPFENSEEATFCRILPDLIRAWEIHEQLTAVRTKRCSAFWTAS